MYPATPGGKKKCSFKELGKGERKKEIRYLRWVILTLLFNQKIVRVRHKNWKFMHENDNWGSSERLVTWLQLLETHSKSYIFVTLGLCICLSKLCLYMIDNFKV